MSQAESAAPKSVKRSVFGTHHNRGRTAFGDTLSRARSAGSPAAASALIDPLGSYRRHKTRLQAATAARFVSARAGHQAVDREEDAEHVVDRFDRGCGD